MWNNEYARTNNDIIYKLELVMRDYTHRRWLQRHSHTHIHAQAAGVEPQDLTGKFSVCQNPTNTLSLNEMRSVKTLWQ